MSWLSTKFSTTSGPPLAQCRGACVVASELANQSGAALWIRGRSRSIARLSVESPRNFGLTG